MQVMSRVLRSFQVEVPLLKLFEAPTVAEMGVVIIQIRAKTSVPKDLERVLFELETLSDEGAKRLVVEEHSASDCGDHR